MLPYSWISLAIIRFSRAKLLSLKCPIPLFSHHWHLQYLLYVPVRFPTDETRLPTELELWSFNKTSTIPRHSRLSSYLSSNCNHLQATDSTRLILHIFSTETFGTSFATTATHCPQSFAANFENLSQCKFCSVLPAVSRSMFQVTFGRKAVCQALLILRHPEVDFTVFWGQVESQKQCPKSLKGIEKKKSTNADWDWSGEVTVLFSRCPFLNGRLDTKYMINSLYYSTKTTNLSSH